MKKSTSQPRILIVDDDPRIGDLLKKRVTERFQWQVCFPRSQERLQDTVLNEAFDTVVVDTNLSLWEKPIRVFDKQVRDGIDFARVYCEFQPQTLIVLFGPGQLPYQTMVKHRIEGLAKCKVRTIDRPLPRQEAEVQAVLEALKPEIRETTIIHKANPIFQSSEAFEGLPAEERILRNRLLYRQACHRTERWVNFNLKEYGDSSWTVLCGGNIQKNYYGELLNGSTPIDVVKIKEQYPKEAELKKLEQTQNTSAFVLWNTSPSTLMKQFDMPRFEKIPEELIDDFGMAVADPCAQAYKEGEKDLVIRWCRNWMPKRPLGQMDVLRSIFKSLNGDRPKSVKSFSKQCKDVGLYRVVDVYRARVEKIVEPENTAFIELTDFEDNESFTAPFDLKKMKGKGVKELDQCFEYTVYMDQLERSFGQIELTE